MPQNQIPSSRQPITQTGALADRVWWRFWQLLWQGSLSGLSLPASAPIGFYGAQARSQPSAAGNTTTSAAGSGATVHVDTTFTGGIGATAYTTGDIVAALKTIGLLKT